MTAVVNLHTRRLAVAADEVGKLLDGLAGELDPLWPHERWPAVRLDQGLAVGSDGGHGPIRYGVVAYQPSRAVLFRFRAPAGFDGHHGWLVEDTDDGGTVLRHELWMHLRGAARLSWPLLYRPMHNALIEDALDKAERSITGRRSVRSRWSPWVRLLRYRAAARFRTASRRSGRTA